MKPKNRILRDITTGLLLLFMLSMWFLIFFNPVIIAFYKGSPIWLFLYILLIPEIIAGSLISHLIFEFYKP